MAHSYTRQRQGRDFSLIKRLRAAETSAESTRTESAAKESAEQKQSLLKQLEQCKAEREWAPVDGNEPAPERGL